MKMNESIGHRILPLNQVTTAAMVMTAVAAVAVVAVAFGAVSCFWNRQWL